MLMLSYVFSVLSNWCSLEYSANQKEKDKVVLALKTFTLAASVIALFAFLFKEGREE